MSGDLDEETLTAVLGDRPLRSLPAVLSTESQAMAWARAGVAGGAVVVADYQAAPRGRSGLPWTVTAGRGLGFSLVTRNELDAEREGWPYLPAALAVAEALGSPDLEWPDSVGSGEDPEPLARLGVCAEPTTDGGFWATVTVLVTEAAPPRAALLAELVAALESRLEDTPERVLEAYRSRCFTLGSPVRARMIPLGPAGAEIVGEAVDVLADGALVIRTERGNRVAVLPQHLGVLEAADGPPQVPSDIRARLER